MMEVGWCIRAIVHKNGLAQSRRNAQQFLRVFLRYFPAPSSCPIRSARTSSPPEHRVRIFLVRA